MPFLGWLAGQRILEFIADYDHWVAFGLLVFVGCRMIWESAHTEDSTVPARDTTKGWRLILLSLATSIDALTVGFSFSFVGVSIIYGSLIIGAVAFSVTICGLLLGKRVGKIVGRRAEIVGGVILILIGLRVLTSHIMA